MVASTGHVSTLHGGGFRVKGKAVKKQSKAVVSKAESQTPLPLRHVFNFEDEWTGMENALYVREHGGRREFFLASVKDEHDTPDRATPTTIAGALRWYSDCYRFAGGTSGSIGELCTAAADAIDRKGTR